MIEIKIEVEFGDCDPAGIVFYPRFFSWFDATFQKWLRVHSLEQAELRSELDIIGTGLMDVGAQFLSPVRPGDVLSLNASLKGVTNKAMRIEYTGYVGERLAIKGFEVRGLFVLRDGQLRAAPLQTLWDKMGIDPTHYGDN